ncbi:MAG: phytoene/squalene synthase family protein [Myxococcota bacterium]
MAVLGDDAVRRCRASLEANSKSFALAARLLPRRCRDEAAVVYAWCRYVDDAIDEAPRGEAAVALERLETELDAVFAAPSGPARFAGSPEAIVLEAFQEIVWRRAIPRLYPGELLAGMRMDVDDVAYPDDETLLRYCHRVAGVVGLLMCHVMGLRGAIALEKAAHLGWAMQLTNICRDVLEDWERGRLYLPDDRLAAAGAPGLRLRLGGRFPDDAAGPVARVVEDLLAEAERYYASADAGLEALSWRNAMAVRTARLVYSAIGERIADQDHDVRRGRAFVSRAGKLALVRDAAVASAQQLPRRTLRRLAGEPAATEPPGVILRFEDLFRPTARRARPPRPAAPSP